MSTTQRNISDSFYYPVFFTGVLWIIHLIQSVFNLSFIRLGILPRNKDGLIGIFTAPLIHKNFFHLLSNSIPLLISGFLIFLFYRKQAWAVIAFVYIMTGVCVWLFANNDAYHIGASGLIYGLLSYLFFNGIFRRDFKSVIIAVIILIFYGGIFWGIFPNQPGISWQSHLFGTLAGALASYNFKKKH